MSRLRADLSAAGEAVVGRACVYATGSFGRLEASEHSDLDVFIVSKMEDAEPEPTRLLDGIQEIKLQSELIKVVEKHEITKFDAGGKYLKALDADGLVRWLGSNEDDYRNTLTARMLMLLESKCLIGDDVYLEVIDSVLSKYFRDFTSHEHDFIPAFLINDILRMWRTFCVNYEFFRTGRDSREKLKNLKLKFSRMNTCYSAVVYLLAVFASNRTVTPADVTRMVELSPTERLEAVATEEKWSDEFRAHINQHAEEALSHYSDFLQLTHQPTKSAVRSYTADELNWRSKSYGFGGSLASLIDLLGSVSDDALRLRRLILI